MPCKGEALQAELLAGDAEGRWRTPRGRLTRGKSSRRKRRWREAPGGREVSLSGGPSDTRGSHWELGRETKLSGRSFLKSDRGDHLETGPGSGGDRRLIRA